MPPALPPPAPPVEIISIADTHHVSEYYVRMIAHDFGLDATSTDQMVETIRGESGFDPTKKGDHGTSWGLVQIHITEKSHPDISIAEALDPDFSLRFMANEFKNNRKWQWTVWCQKYVPGYPQVPCKSP